MQSSAERARIGLAERLRARREEIEAAVLTRVYAISDPGEAADPTYPEGLRAAVAAALDYGLAGIELGEERAPPAPTPLLAQARLAARNGVSLDTVMRRYFAGYMLLGDFLVEEAQRDEPIRGFELKRLLRAQAARLDRLLTAIGEEHGREAGGQPMSARERQMERVQRLLAGELFDTSELDYDLAVCHLGAIVTGAEAEEVARRLSGLLGRRILVVPHGEETAWLWLGGRRDFDLVELRRLASFELPDGVSLALGEPGRGLPGWRLTHRQARAALPIALRKPEPTRYSDVALLASILNDELLASSLRQLYLAPLEEERDGGEVAKRTLRAYFAAGRNVSSTSAALEVTRRTITNRLNLIEKTLDRPLAAAAADIEAALRLEELGVTNPASRTN